MRHALVTIAAALAALVLPASRAAAQGGTIAGAVVTLGTAEPIPSAQIMVVGGTQRATSDARGQFRLTGLSGATVTLEVRRIGYKVTRLSARVGDENVRVALESNPASLEALVVTGTPGATEKKAIGNSISTVDAAAVTAIAPITSMQSLLNGRAPGVVLQSATGAVGTGGHLRVRGLASLSLGNEPLVYVDGVRVDNDPSTGPANQAFGSSSISRINDINPDDIESIEVLKGPSAATLYGTEASNGVINIITKKGRDGAARWNVLAKQGVNYLQNWKTRFPTNYGLLNGQVVAVSMDSLINANGGDIFRNGRYQETQVSVSGGSSALSYYASGNLLDSQGAEPSNSERHYGARVNVGINPNPRFRTSIDAGYVSGPTNLSAEAGFGGRVWSTVLATPTNYNNPIRHGFYSAIPVEYDEVYHFWQDLDHLTGSIRFENEPTDWFQHRLTFGYDNVQQGDNLFQPRIDSLIPNPSFGSDALGLKDVTQNTINTRTIDYAATATWNVRPTIKSSTSVGGQYYHNSAYYVYAHGEVFPTPGLSSIDATTTNRVNDEDLTENATLGVYGQEQVAWRDRLFLTAALRSDQNSAFGTNFKRVTYPKYSLSWVASDEAFWSHFKDYVQTFRFRGAYGEAGKAPATYAALRTFASVPGYNDSPAVTPQFIGNPNLGPERGKEYELGFDANALDDRLDLQFTYYHKKTTDAILNRQITPSIGFSGTQPFNAGALLNTGLEWTVRATPYRSERVKVDLGFNLATNQNRILSLGQPGLTFVTAGTYVQHHVGYPAYGWFEKQLLNATVDAKGNILTANCADGKGGSMPCWGADGKWGTADDAPLVYLGRSTPPVEGSYTATVTLYDRLHLYTMLDFERGWKKLDGTTRVRCTFFGGRCPENFTPAQADPNRVAEVNSNHNLVDFLITNASFTKFREFTVSYDLPSSVARQFRTTRASIALSGHNLHTWTPYTGLEPESMFNGGSRGGNTSWEQTVLPQLTQWVLSVNLGF
ncbi:MAG TPA: SusC/RagA family TonB-linked outer membrane protein [Gemmatimonadaceae bacterium]|nr:SusC/RagA family TonB-linked outer membrane protein [Gemmatimonadaceae bacterium]